jgi:hypothetical protein
MHMALVDCYLAVLMGRFTTRLESQTIPTSLTSPVWLLSSLKPLSSSPNRRVTETQHASAHPPSSKIQTRIFYFALSSLHPAQTTKSRHPAIFPIFLDVIQRLFVEEVSKGESTEYIGSVLRLFTLGRQNSDGYSPFHRIVARLRIWIHFVGRKRPDGCSPFHRIVTHPRIWIHPATRLNFDSH